ncbi:MAG: hypothetical protein QG646_4100, partial [Euryarchaeota archaeon]|nr:hypothetical protein [Euryarchaeota archaeon]
MVLNILIDSTKEGISQKKIVPRMIEYEDDGSWLWVAFAPECRLIVAFII